MPPKMMFGLPMFARNVVRRWSSSRRFCAHRLFVHHRPYRVRHESKNLEMVNLFADSALAAARLGKCSLLQRNLGRSRHPCQTNLACQLDCVSLERAARQRCAHGCYAKPHCGSSNPHSCIVSSSTGGTRRGFLPRGLYDACPHTTVGYLSSVVRGRHPTTLNCCRQSRMSGNWKLKYVYGSG